MKSGRLSFAAVVAAVCTTVLIGGCERKPMEPIDPPGSPARRTYQLEGVRIEGTFLRREWKTKERDLSLPKWIQSLGSWISFNIGGQCSARMLIFVRDCEEKACGSRTPTRNTRLWKSRFERGRGITYRFFYEYLIRGASKSVLCRVASRCGKGDLEVEYAIRTCRSLKVSEK
jgi:hypothetical protein